MNAVLNICNYLLHGVHLSIIVFCIIGWLIPPLQPWHLLLCILIAGSWFLLGTCKGWGYCLVTDWQWRLLRSMGRTELPTGYMPMLYQFVTGRAGDVQRIDRITQIVFYSISLVSLRVNWGWLSRLF